MLTAKQIAAYREIVATDPDLVECVKEGDDAKLAAMLSSKLPPVPKWGVVVDDQQLYILFGAEQGETFLQTLGALAQSGESYAPIFARVLGWLVTPGKALDLGLDVTQQNLIKFSAAQGGPLNDNVVNTLIALGSQQPIITAEEAAGLR